MAGTLVNIANFSRLLNNLTKLYANTLVTTNYGLYSISKSNKIISQNQRSLFHTTIKQYNTSKIENKVEEKKVNTPKGLMEFFDDPKNWGAQKVKTGRAWKKDELRLKSNEDLHKLWFVLLKERNMLKTMEHTSNEEARLFPNPERIDKVEDSMENLEQVVRERNNAYYLLETGEHGERPTKMVNNPLGLRYWYRLRQYMVPRFMNVKFNKEKSFKYGGYAVHKFRRHFFEKQWLEKRKEINRIKGIVARYFRHFPNVDIEAIHAEFPQLTREEINKIRISKRARGHYTTT